MKPGNDHGALPGLSVVGTDASGVVLSLGAGGASTLFSVSRARAFEMGTELLRAARPCFSLGADAAEEDEAGSDAPVA